MLGAGVGVAGGGGVGDGLPREGVLVAVALFCDMLVFIALVTLVVGGRLLAWACVFLAAGVDPRALTRAGDGDGDDDDGATDAGGGQYDGEDTGISVGAVEGGGADILATSISGPVSCFLEFSGIGLDPPGCVGVGGVMLGLGSRGGDLVGRLLVTLGCFLA